MENNATADLQKNEDKVDGTVYVPYPGADIKYKDNHRDWRIYNPEKYLDPNWSPDKE